MRSDTEWAALDGLQSDNVRVVQPALLRAASIPRMILLALTQGADGVLVVGCSEGECHYKRGTYLGRSKVALLDTMLAQMGIRHRSACALPNWARWIARALPRPGRGDVAPSSSSRAVQPAGAHGKRGDMDKLKLAVYWASSCGGCDIAIVELGEHLLELAQVADIVFWPAAMDFKYEDVEAMADGTST